MPGIIRKNQKLICLLLALAMLLAGLDPTGLKSSRQGLRIVNTMEETAVTVGTAARQLVLRPGVSYFLHAFSLTGLFSFGLAISRFFTDRTVTSQRIILSFIHDKDGQKSSLPD